MKKRTVVIILLAIASLALLYESKIYYPPHPIESVSKKQLYDIGESAINQLQFVTNTDKRDWYITKNSNEVNKLLKQFGKEQGWQFTGQDGSGYFFKKADETLIITVEMWSKKFKLIKVPSDIQATREISPVFYTFLSF